MAARSDVPREDELTALLEALADPRRREILSLLARAPRTSADLTEATGLSIGVVRRHLRVLEDAGLLTRTREGRANVCRLDARPLGALDGWVTPFRHFMHPSRFA